MGAGDILKLAQRIWNEDLRQRRQNFYNRVRAIHEECAHRGMEGGALLSAVLKKGVEEQRDRAALAREMLERTITTTGQRLSANDLTSIYRDLTTDIYQDVKEAYRDSISILGIDPARRPGMLLPLATEGANAIAQQEALLELFANSAPASPVTVFEDLRPGADANKSGSSVSGAPQHDSPVTDHKYWVSLGVTLFAAGAVALSTSVNPGYIAMTLLGLYCIVAPYANWWLPEPRPSYVPAVRRTMIAGVLLAVGIAVFALIHQQSEKNPSGTTAAVSSMHVDRQAVDLSTTYGHRYVAVTEYLTNTGDEAVKSASYPAWEFDRTSNVDEALRTANRVTAKAKSLASAGGSLWYSTPAHQGWFFTMNSRFLTKNEVRDLIGHKFTFYWAAVIVIPNAAPIVICGFYQGNPNVVFKCPTTD